MIQQTVESHPAVLKEPAPAVLLMELGDSSIDFAVRPWVSTLDYWVVRDELMETVKQRLEAADCSIPYPQRDVHVHNVK